MDDRFSVGCFECFRNLLRQGQRFIKGDWTARNALGQCLAFHKFQNEKLRVLKLLQVVNRSDMRMIQRSQNMGFALKPRNAFGIT